MEFLLSSLYLTFPSSFILKFSRQWGEKTHIFLLSILLPLNKQTTLYYCKYLPPSFCRHSYTFFIRLIFEHNSRTNKQTGWKCEKIDNETFPTELITNSSLTMRLFKLNLNHSFVIKYVLVQLKSCFKRFWQINSTLPEVYFEVLISHPSYQRIHKSVCFNLE